MSYDEIQTGTVIRYPYLWSREAGRGETEGRKSRPVVVALRVKRTGKPDLLALLPITPQAPIKGRIASEIPEAVKQRAGLDRGVRQWIMLDEYNAETLPGTFYLDPQIPIGRLNDLYLRPLLRDFLGRINQVEAVRRHD